MKHPEQGRGPEIPNKEMSFADSAALNKAIDHVALPKISLGNLEHVNPRYTELTTAHIHGDASRFFKVVFNSTEFINSEGFNLKQEQARVERFENNLKEQYRTIYDTLESDAERKNFAEYLSSLDTIAKKINSTSAAFFTINHKVFNVNSYTKNVAKIKESSAEFEETLKEKPNKPE